MKVALPAVLCLAYGFALVRLCLPRRMPLAGRLLLEVSLSVGCGLGIFSVIFFIERVVGVNKLTLADIGILAALLAGLSIKLFRQAKGEQSPLKPWTEERQEPVRLRIVAIAGFAIVLCAAVYSAVARVLAYPHGGWDAFAIWNLRARFLLSGGCCWRNAFSALIPRSHPDYPLLLPAATAHFWAFLGYDNPGVPAVIGVVFTFATAGMLFAALWMIRGITNALLGTTALLATPFFVEQGTTQCANVPLGLFFLSGLVLLCLHDEMPGRSLGLPALAGIVTGFAAWTKNEGLLLSCVVIAARLLTCVRLRSLPRSDVQSITRKDWTATGALLVGMAPAVLLMVCFKRFFAGPGEYFSDSGAMLHKLLMPARYLTVLRWYGKDFFRFGHWTVVPGTLLLLVICLMAQKNDATPRQSGFRTSVLALTLMAVGYFVIYLITPHDLEWHLRFSLDRLFLQLWPSIIFLVFVRSSIPAKLPAVGLS